MPPSDAEIATRFYKVAGLCRILGKMPTNADMRLWVRSDPSFPNDKTVASHVGSIAEVVAALRMLAQTPEYGDIATFLPEPKGETIPPSPRSQAVEGTVYLLKSGQHYKVSRSDEIERRVKEITVALPEATLVLAIKTDDTPGIEAYWHKRFADRRATVNGSVCQVTM